MIHYIQQLMQLYPSTAPITLILLIVLFLFMLYLFARVVGLIQ